MLEPDHHDFGEAKPRAPLAHRRAFWLPAMMAAAAACLSSCFFDVSPVYDCTQNADCLSALGDFHICRRAPDEARGTCAALLSAECTTVEGEWKNDDAFLFGSVLPTAGRDFVTGKACENAIKLAVADFNGDPKGLPAVPGLDSKRRRPLAFVGCNDNSDQQQGVVAARHLEEDVGVSAIVGPQWSGITKRIANDVTIGANVLLISPSATAISISELQDNGLVWRTSPSDVFQAAALAQYIPVVEGKIRAERELPVNEKIRLAILYQGTEYGNGIREKILETLELNGKPALDPSNSTSLLSYDYGDPSDQDPPLSYDQAVTRTLAFKPDIVLDLCTAEGITDILEPIEEQWGTLPANTPRPRWILGDGGQTGVLWELVGSNDDLRRRVTGTVPGANSDNFEAFKNKYRERAFDDGTDPVALGPAGSYDAVYLLSYSAVSLGANPLTGPNLAAGFASLIPQTGAKAVDAGVNDIDAAFNTLIAGGKIDFNGASGPLDFNLTTGEAASDIQVWCMPKDNTTNKATSAQNSGLYLDSVSMRLKDKNEGDGELKLDAAICGFE